MSFRLWHIIPIITVLSLLLFGKSLAYYFLQDDWFVLNSTNDFLGFFKFRTDIIYWRPIGMFMFFTLAKNIFDLNPFGFHLIAFIFHISNSLLLALLSFRIFKSKQAAFISALLFASASFHFMTLSWLSLTWMVIGTSFFLLSLNFYLIWREIGKPHLALLVVCLYLLSLASFEFALILPAFIILFEVFRIGNGEFDPRKLFPIIPMIVINLSYLYFRFVLFPVPARGDYSIVLNFDVVKNLFWYVFWLFNLPEELKYQIIVSKLQITESLKNAAGILIAPIFGLFIIQTITLAILARLNRLKMLAFSAGSYILGLTPVLFIPNHTFPYYLSIASIGPIIVIGLWMAKALKSNKVVLVGTFIFCFLLLSFISISLEKRIHWVSGEQAISKATLFKIKKTYPSLPTNSTLIVYPANEQVKQSLMDQNALQVVYDDQSIKTVYNQDIVEEKNIQNIYYVDLK